MKQNNNIKKAQIFSLDFILSILLFISVIFILINSWESTLNKNVITEERNNLELIARNILSILTQTEGNPTNWVTNPNSIGLVISPSINNNNATFKSRPSAITNYGTNIFSLNKLNSFQSLSYEDSKNYIGLVNEDEHYLLSIKQWNNTDYNLIYTKGILPNSSTSNVINLNRYALLNNEWIELNLKVWKIE